MKPWLHSISSANRYGGEPEDYLAVHDFMDSTKSAMADVRHRAVLHSAFGIFLAERVFGTNVINSKGKLVSVRDVAEDHVREDLGFIPSMETWLKGIKIEPWMAGQGKHGEKKFIAMTEEDKAVTEFAVLNDGKRGPPNGAPKIDATIDGGYKIFKELQRKRETSPGISPSEIDGSNVTAAIGAKVIASMTFDGRPPEYANVKDWRAEKALDELAAGQPDFNPREPANFKAE